MDHALAVGIVERLGGLARDPDRVGHRELPLASEPVPERFALDERHREPEPRAARRARVARVEHRQNVGVLQPRRELDLTLKPLGTQAIGQLGAQHLERDRTVVAQVPGEVDRRHPAAAELALERVAAGQGGLESLERLARRGGHRAVTLSPSRPA